MISFLCTLIILLSIRIIIVHILLLVPEITPTSLAPVPTSLTSGAVTATGIVTRFCRRVFSTRLVEKLVFIVIVILLHFFFELLFDCLLDPFLGRLLMVGFFDDILVHGLNMLDRELESPKSLALLVLFADIANVELFACFSFLQFAFRTAVFDFVLIYELLFWINPVSWSQLDSLECLAYVLLKESNAATPAGDRVHLEISENFNLF